MLEVLYLLFTLIYFNTSPAILTLSFILMVREWLNPSAHSKALGNFECWTYNFKCNTNPLTTFPPYSLANHTVDWPKNKMLIKNYNLNHSKDESFADC